jgi:two-component system, cell cycle response regulator DivK
MASVLIVDDNLLNLELTGFLLREDGLEVLTAPDAAGTLSLLSKRGVDLILMDIQLPDVDGIALTRRLKAAPSTRGVVIVAYTAYAMKGDEARMLEAGCDSYIAKPIDVHTFAAQVRALLPPGVS